MISGSILWLDLETTGTNEMTDDILEVAAVITTQTLEEVSRFHGVAHTALPFDQMDPQVQQMHTQSGLWADVQASVLPHWEVALRLESWLCGYISRWDRIPLAGSGVAHFDHRFIRYNWPAIDKRLTFWHYDVGTVRRLARLAGVTPPFDQASKTHRAMDDVLLHIDEARWFLRLFHEWRSLKPLLDEGVIAFKEVPSEEAEDRPSA